MTYIDYHHSSSLDSLLFREQRLQDSAEWPSSWSSIEFRVAPIGRKCVLDEAPDPPTSLSLLQQRRSERTEKSERWDLGSLGTLLSESFGIRATEPRGARRAYPSAGARFPIEAYVLSRDSSATDNVAYYSPLEHTLYGVKNLTSYGKALTASFGAPWVAQCTHVVVLTAIMERSARKYGDRAYRFALLESGHLAQNMLLVATALSRPATPVGGFADRALTQVLDVDGRQELVTYAVALP